MKNTMGPSRQKHMKPGKSLDADVLGKVVQIGQKLSTIVTDGIKYPCQICNRSFRDEKLASSHLQKCKPRVYLLTSQEDTNKSNKNNDRDPYEIIPEEIESEGQILNNNSTNHNKNGSGHFNKWRKHSAKCNNNNETTLITIANQQPYSPVSKIATNSNCITQPKKNRGPAVGDNQKSEEIVDKECSVGLASRTEETMSKNNEVNATEKQTTKRKKATLNTEKQKRNYRQLTEQEIAERLKKISERLKKHKQPEIINEEEEEEERREIEERLSVLNKESEVCIIQNGDEENDVRLKESKFCSQPSGINAKNCKVGTIPNIFGEISKNNLVQQCFGNMQRMNNEVLNSPLEFRDEGEQNPQSKGDEVVIITQRPDGQLHGCRKCSQVFLSSLELLRHSRRDHTYPRIIMAPSEIKKFMTLRDRSHCPICEKPLSSTYKSIYVKHLQTHSCVLEHICPICKKKFKRRDHMRAHQKRHIVGDNVESTANGREGTEMEDSEVLAESSQIS